MGEPIVLLTTPPYSGFFFDASDFLLQLFDIHLRFSQPQLASCTVAEQTGRISPFLLAFALPFVPI
ncbi:hypothetical protein TK45_11500 [Bowmanella sp. JS7-9]|nr:hypothetical protein TK45_11500 [Bowmanella sp. JS7-9]